MHSIQIEPQGEKWLNNAIDENFKPTGTVRAAFFVADKKGIECFMESIICRSPKTEIHLLLGIVRVSAMELVKKFPLNVIVKYLQDNIHAKTIILESELTGRLCIGSANLTISAMISKEKEMNVNIVDLDKNDDSYKKSIEWFKILWEQAQYTTIPIPDDTDLFQGIYNINNLFDYQKNAVENLNSFYFTYSKKKGKYNTLLAMPTGSGKTIVASYWIAMMLKDKRIFWTTRQHEILIQAKKQLIKFGIPAHHIKYIRNQKQFNHIYDNHRIILCLNQSLNIDTTVDKHFDVVIYDEAHHINPGHSETENLLNSISYTMLVGMTATPFRTNEYEDQRFCDFFHSRYCNRTELKKAKDKLEHNRGYVYYISEADKKLVGHDNKPVLAKRDHQLFKETEFTVIINNWNKRAIEFNKQVYEFNNPKTNAYVVKETLKWYLKETTEGKGAKSILLFACNSDHANELGKLFKKLAKQYNQPKIQVFHTLSIDEDSSDFGFSCFDSSPEGGDNREVVINMFKFKEINILITIGLVSEGIDIPSVDCIAVARPTLSPKLYRQWVGRGLRGPAIPDGKPVVTVLDFVAQVEAHKGKFMSVHEDAYGSRKKDETYKEEAEDIRNKIENQIRKSNKIQKHSDSYGNNSSSNKAKSSKKTHKRESPKPNAKGEEIEIYMNYKRRTYNALFFTKEQQILYKGKWFSPSGAAKHIKGKEASGWDDWKLAVNEDKLQTIRKNASSNQHKTTGRKFKT